MELLLVLPYYLITSRKIKEISFVAQVFLACRKAVINLYFIKYLLRSSLIKRMFRIKIPLFS